jgi:hypothetical protein
LKKKAPPLGHKVDNHKNLVFVEMMPRHIQVKMNFVFEVNLTETSSITSPSAHSFTNSVIMGVKYTFISFTFLGLAIENQNVNRTADMKTILSYMYY